MDPDTENTGDITTHNESTENMNTGLRTLSQSQMVNHLKAWLGTYSELVSGVQMLADTTIEFNEGSDGRGENDQTQADALLRLRQEAGGESRVVGGRVEGAPELAVKMFDGVARSAMRRWKRTFEKKGIIESILVNEEGTMPWYSPGKSMMYPDEKEVVSGTTFPGLGFNLDHFYKDDVSAQLPQLRKRVGSVRHQQFEELCEGCE